MWKTEKSNLQRFHDEEIAYLTDCISKMDIWKRQEFFLNCMKIIDKTFVDSISTKDKGKAQFFTDVLHFAYPVLIEYAYTEEFEQLPAAVLAELTEESLLDCRTFLSACRLAGWSAYLLELERLKIVKIKDFFNRSKIVFLQKNNRIEYIESKFIQYYEWIISSQLQNDPRYKESVEQRENIINRMKALCFVWQEHFIGYDGDQDVENYFNNLAYLDSIHDTEWDMYSQDVLFNNVTYASFVDSVVDLSGYAIKHLYFVNILKEDHPELLTENLFYLLKTKDDLLKLIKENGNLSIEQADVVLNCLSLCPRKQSLYINSQATCAPLIKISTNQYLHSCAGSLYHPFSFMLENLTVLYPNDCSRNRAKREGVFRDQLYEMFPDWQCIKRPINITKKGQRITDIDAAVFDSKTGEIALFQFKWQGHTSLSPKTLLSKSKNYINEVTEWAEKLTNWIEESTESDIGRLLGVKSKFVDKSKIYLFAIGREHGNYSGTAPKTTNCVWIQWYHLLNYILRVGGKINRISEMHRDLKEESPHEISINWKCKVHKYGKYRFVM